MYKKSVLDKTNINLPKHVFYEDNIFIYLPLINTETLYYLNLDFYQYFIGRADQSVNEDALIKKSSHQVLVTKLACNAYDLTTVKNKKLRNLMYRECVFLMSIGVLFSRLMMSDEGEKQYKQLWEDVKVGNPKLYKKMRHFTLASLASIPGGFGRIVCVICYNIAHKLVRFN